ncbi:ATP-binding protein [Goodfellowiella coeruleoviolacea]|uniref:AAA+-type ATPase, SpoVK/Ycf46/Vps4 family n=1 Tax=Goodfellowiella coeruleoviolacea TaxID=334858 RepID=A0AAE3G7V3_9PSEU|nr:ATP-binding protein [Goodfellowiella coeruleoviolacea]MCP2163321.1 AAA+-type ATPase, SpoVK/Ycf46/Vps4 family [Goodfellowiella coeruleoviolacea]
MSDVAVQHLRIRLAAVHRALRLAVERQARLAALLTRPDLTPYCVTDEQVGVLLDQVDAAAGAMTEPAPQPPPEPEAERDLRRRAAAHGVTLPLDALATRFGLTRVEQDALLLVAAPELDPGYERIYAYIVDNLNRRLPSVELLVTVGADTPAARLARRRALGPTGPLRRFGLLRACGAAPVELAQELVLGPGVFDFLLGWGGDVGLLGHDPGEVRQPQPQVVPPGLAADRLARLGRALGAGEIDLLGLWGCPADSQLDVVHALAAAAGRPPRVLTAGVEDDLRVAAALDAVLWVPTDDLHDEPRRSVAEILSGLLARSRVPVCLTGVKPWRPASLLAARAYAELTVPVPGFRDRRAMWSAALPQLDGTALADLAARYRMSGGELRAVASVAAAGARVAGNGRPEPVAAHVEPAIATVTRHRNGSAVQSILPRRAIEDLVLQDAQLHQILEIASAFRAWPRIAESWGFARRSAHGGVKALFTGEPGTGKTMSAEIVTGMLGLELLKVDLAQVVSKWVGETEKNMEAAFRQAEESHAVLLFDEADALFGKRGEVRHGTDRYANLEVGYLLQRLEASDGLVILTSNLKDNIDPAFTRRFHFVVHFPRPGAPERRRLWRLAFPEEAPLDADVDLDALCRLDMTGAGITAAARTAALAAADAGSTVIGMRHVVRGVARQFQREARLLRPSELGPHAHLLADEPTPG